MTDQKSPIDHLLDLMLYAPVGVAITAREELPRMVEKGRQRVTGQVMLARMLGQFAVNQGQQEASRLARQAGDVLAGLGILPTDHAGPTQPPGPVEAPAGAGVVGEERPGGVGGAEAPRPAAVDGPWPEDPAERRPERAGTAAPWPEDTAPLEPTAAEERTGAPGAMTTGAVTTGVVGAAATGNGAAPRPAPSSDGLAIPGYDSLSASQVVQRLAGLAPDELEDVRAYEATTRGRRTILNRIAQLQTGAG